MRGHPRTKTRAAGRRLALVGRGDLWYRSGIVAGNHSITTGTIIGDDFEIVRPLSSGGMGSVYVARQLSINVLRALKLMNAPLVENTEMRERFVRRSIQKRGTTRTRNLAWSCPGWASSSVTRATTP